MILCGVYGDNLFDGILIVARFTYDIFTDDFGS